MTSRRQFLSGCVLAAVPTLPVFANSGYAGDFDMTQYLKELKELMDIDSKSGHIEGANQIADILEKRFKSIGWTVTKRDCEGRGRALVATNTPDQTHYDVVLSVHSDTVQAVGNASKYPLTIKDNIAHGAGVADDKSSLNAVWWICKKIPKKAQEKLKIAVIVNPGEESGSPASRAFMDEQAKKTDVALVYEPGRPGNGFVRSRKGSMFLTVNFHGRPAHAGNNPQDGRNAVEAMAIAIPEIKAIASKYQDVTLNADVVKGGTTPNTIAEDATVVFDFRFFNDQTRDAVLEDIENLCKRGFAPDVTSELKYVAKSSALAHTEKSQKVIEVIDTAAKELGQPAPKWMDVGGASDGNRFSGAGAAVACAMGVVGGDLHHPEKEWSDMTSVKPRIELGRKVLELLAEQK